MKEIYTPPDLWENYSQFKNEQFNQRYLPLEKVKIALKKLTDSFALKTEGFSVLQKPIWSVSFGNGKTKILMWSQMHGNETTTTKAVFDLLNFLEKSETGLSQEIRSNCSLKIIPILNPDGAEIYTRGNSNKIDLNRDAQNLSQPESRLLDKISKEFEPDFCFNLHDQRTIYSAGKAKKSAIVSFLAPAMDAEKTVNETRKISMHHIGAINDCLQQFVPNHIGRYDDAFNPDCVGDKFQSLGASTLLFEAGHFPEDYQRETTRKLIFIALVEALSSISKNPYFETGVHKYNTIPQNEKLFYDVLLRNVLLKGKKCDIGIQFNEKLENQQIVFVPIVEEIGDLQGFYGHREVEGKEQNIVVNNLTEINIGTEIKKIGLGNSVISLNFTK